MQVLNHQLTRQSSVFRFSHFFTWKKTKHVSTCPNICCRCYPWPWTRYYIFLIKTMFVVISDTYRYSLVHAHIFLPLLRTVKTPAKTPGGMLVVGPCCAVENHDRCCSHDPHCHLLFIQTSGAPQWRRSCFINRLSADNGFTFTLLQVHNAQTCLKMHSTKWRHQIVRWRHDDVVA